MSNGGTDPQHILLLGQIKGTLEGVLTEQASQRTLIQGIDKRLQDEERTTVRTSMVTSSIIGIGMALLLDQARAWLHRGGGGGS